MIRIAFGEKLSYEQKDIKFSGCAIECRIYAEDSSKNFLPSIGRLTRYIEPSGKNVRVDSGVVEGSEISMFYDPMISKLIVHASTREKAIKLMLDAIDDYDIVGVKTTLPFCSYALNHDSFRSGNYDTRFVSLYFNDPSIIDPNKETLEAALASICMLEQKDKINSFFLPSKSTNWTVNR